MTAMWEERDGAWALLIPTGDAERMGARAGAPFEIPSPSRVPSRFDRSLEEILAEVTPENLHGETDWGPPVGREVR